MQRIGWVADPLAKRALRRLRRGFDYGALRVDLPSVIEAAQPAKFITPIREGRAPVRAMLLDETECAFGIAEGDQVFTEQSYTHRPPSRLRQLLRHHGWNPIAP